MTGVFITGVLNLQPRQKAQLYHLLGHAESAGDQRLRGDDGSRCCQDHQRNQRPVGGHVVERVFHRLGFVQQQSALAKIIQRQTRHDQAKPGQTNRLFAKVAHIGIQSFATRHAQNHRAQNQKRGAGLFPHELHRVIRIDGPQNRGIAGDVVNAQSCNSDKPNRGDGAKKIANTSSTTLLYRKQSQQNNQGQRNHIALEVG